MRSYAVVEKCRRSGSCSHGDSCHDDARCEDGPCSVERLCPSRVPAVAVTDGPVCAGDGRTYAGPCAVKLAACMRGVSLTVVHDGPCDERSGSGSNDEPFATGRPKQFIIYSLLRTVF